MNRKATSSGKYRKSIVVIKKSAQVLIFQEVLTNGSIVGNRVIRRFSRMKKVESISRNLVSFDAFWYMQFDSMRQPLGNTTEIDKQYCNDKKQVVRLFR